MHELVPARFERAVAAAGGLALAASGALILPATGRPDLTDLLLAPPFVTGGLAAAIAIAPSARARRTWLAIIDAVMLATAVCYVSLGMLAMVVPGMIALAAFTSWFGVAREGDTEERAARTALATGALWAMPFALLGQAGFDEGAVRLALAGAVALAVAGLAWLHAIKHEREERDAPPRATARS